MGGGAKPMDIVTGSLSLKLVTSSMDICLSFPFHVTAKMF